MTPKQKTQINEMTYEEMLRRWRFAPAGDPLFAGDTGDYFEKVMQEKKQAAGPGAAVAISKGIGWGRPEDPVDRRAARGAGMIIGDQDTRRVIINGEEDLDPFPSQKVWNHSPTGFNWGYGGSGPAQLALALLMRFGVPAQRAVQLHQDFKWDFLQTPDLFLRIEAVRAWITLKGIQENEQDQPNRETMT